MTGFLQIGLQTYQMLEVSEAEMDRLMKAEDQQFDWPFRFDKHKRVWPTPPGKTEVFFYD